MMPNNLTVAITGGIGSGKSTFAGIIRELGYPVYSCDEIYKQIQTESQFLSLIQENFGIEAVCDGKLNRQYLSDVVFNDKERLKRLNDLTHPLIMQRLFEKMSEHKIAFAEVPLLFEIHAEEQFDRVVIVMRNEETRIRSVMERDGLSEDRVKQRIKNQINYQEKMKNGYTVIRNDGNLESLKSEAVHLLSEIQK